MSMRWLTILQFLEIFAAYGIVTLFLPWRILGKRFHRFSVAEQLIAYFFAGNFLYHLSRLSAAVSSDQQPCDAAPRNCRAIPFYLDLEKKKTDPGSNGEPAGADRTIA